MEIVFDPAKDALNESKHAVSLALAEVLFAGPFMVENDDRFDYGERRQVAYGWIERRLFACVYVERDRARRIISLRKANHREVRTYGNALE